MTSESRLRVGVAGCGRIARVLHIPGYERSPKADLVALYNHRRETTVDLLDAHPRVTLYDEFDRFLDESGVEAISVCTPNAMHAPMAVAALEKGIHVLVEKPMATNLAEARTMIDAAEKGRAVLTVGHSQRYYPVHQEARRIMESGILGRVLQVRTTFGHQGPLNWSPGGKWFVTPDLAGFGVVGDLGVHKVDLLRFLTGEEVTTVAAFELRAETADVDDNAAAVMVLSGGGLVTVSVSWTLRGGDIDDMVVIGEHGSLRIRVEPNAPLVLYREDGERIEFPVHPTPRSEHGALLLDEISEFVGAASGENPNPITGEDGYRALEICAAIDRSARTNTVVHLPLG